MSVTNLHPVLLEIFAAKVTHSSFKNFPPINNIELSFCKISHDFFTRDSSIGSGFNCSKGAGIFDSKFPHAESAGTIRVAI